MFAVRILSFRGRTARGTLTTFGSAAALTSIEREPAISATGYALPRSSRHFEDSRRRSNPSASRIKFTSRSLVDLLIVQLSNLSPLEEVAIVHGPTVMACSSPKATVAVPQNRA